ncbi:hypothetical protein JCM8202_004209 [Rhodotorula sphaerocarpa]
MADSYARLAQTGPSAPDGATPETRAAALLRSLLPPLNADADDSSDTAPARAAPARTRPWVTLTWAQSLDAKIAGPRGQQVTLSGPDSMRLTHELRRRHDSILVGVGTVLNDDPSLTARMPDLLPLAEQPRPIVLDPALRTPLAAKLVANAAAGRSHRPLICTTATEEAVRASAPTDLSSRERTDSHRISLPALLGPASPSPPLAPALGRSLMVEGGASILASFLAEPDLVDLVVVTIAPTFVGPEGVDVPWRSSSAATATGAEPPARGLPRLEPLRTEVFGNDTVLFCRPVWS